VNSAAKSLSGQFCKQNLIGLIPWANVAFGFLARCLNTFVMLSWSYTSRIWIFVISMSAGLVGLAFSVFIDFWFAILAIILIGSSCSFGESLILGYLKSFESTLVGAFSSGTGGAGVGGSSLYLLFQACRLSNSAGFLLMLPTSCPYALSYHLGVAQTAPPAISEDVATDKTALINTNPEIIDPNESTAQLYLRCGRLVAWNFVNLMLVYFFESLPSCTAISAILFCRFSMVPLTVIFRSPWGSPSSTKLPSRSVAAWTN